MSNIEKRNIIIYHSKCVDGFASSWCAKEYYDQIGEEYTFIPIAPNYPNKLFKNPIPCDQIKTIMSFDVGYSFDNFKKLFELYPMIKIFDHHKSSYEDIMKGLLTDKELKNYVLDKYIFDNNECGATLAWKYFNIDKPVPEILSLIHQRDIWIFNSKEDEIISQGLYASIHMNDYDHFTKLMNKSPEYYREIGNIITEDIKRKNNCNYPSGANHTIEGMRCFILNTTENISDLGNFVCGLKRTTKIEDADGNVIVDKTDYLTDIALIWRHSYRDNKYHVSLRSNKDREEIDTTKISSKYGGGGHKSASGFTVDNIFDIIM